MEDITVIYAEQRSSQTQYELGQMFSNASENRDYEQAAHWFSHAARQGNANAQYKMGLMYSKGIGVDLNDLKAYAWLKASATQGCSKARRYLERIAARIPADQLAQAHSLSLRYYRKYVAPF